MRVRRTRLHIRWRRTTWWWSCLCCIFSGRKFLLGSAVMTTAARVDFWLSAWNDAPMLSCQLIFHERLRWLLFLLCILLFALDLLCTCFVLGLPGGVSCCWIREHGANPPSEVQMSTKFSPHPKYDGPIRNSFSCSRVYAAVLLVIIFNVCKRWTLKIALQLAVVCYGNGRSLMWLSQCVVG